MDTHTHRQSHTHTYTHKHTEIQRKLAIQVDLKGPRGGLSAYVCVNLCVSV